jgi:hypothetical protein
VSIQNSNNSEEPEAVAVKAKNTIECFMTPFAFIILLGNLALIAHAYKMGGSLWSTCPDSRSRTRNRTRSSRRRLSPETVVGFVIRVIAKNSAGTLTHAMNRLCRVVSAADCHKIRRQLEVHHSANQPPTRTVKKR